MSTLFEDALAGSFLAKRVLRVREVAKSVYSSLESSPLVQSSFQALDKRTNLTSVWQSHVASITAVATKLNTAVDTTVCRLDTTISRAATNLTASIHMVTDKATQAAQMAESRKLQVQQATSEVTRRVRTVMVSPQWLRDVNSALAPRVQEMRNSTSEQVHDFRAFFTAAVESFQLLPSKIKARASDVSATRLPTYEEFVAQLKTRLPADYNTMWDDKLVVPAKTFYAAAESRLKELATDFQLRATATTTAARNQYINSIKPAVMRVWEQAVPVVSGTSARVNARTVYNTALEYYASLDLTKRRQDASVLVEGLKQQLLASPWRTVWTDKLTQPLAELFSNAKQVTLARTAQTRQSISSFSSSSSAVLQRRWVELLDTASHQVDTLLPETQSQVSSEATLSSISERVLRRLHGRFSSSRVQLAHSSHSALTAGRDYLSHQLAVSQEFALAVLSRLRSQVSSLAASTSSSALAPATAAVSAQLQLAQLRVAEVYSQTRTAVASVLSRDGLSPAAVAKVQAILQSFNQRLMGLEGQVVSQLTSLASLVKRESILSHKKLE